MDELIQTPDLPEGFEYPQALLDLVDQGGLKTGPWRILSGKWLLTRYDGLKQRYPNRTLVPFARRTDNDDVACFEFTESTKKLGVSVVHDFASTGWESREHFAAFEDWLVNASIEAQNWD